MMTMMMMMVGYSDVIVACVIKWLSSEAAKARTDSMHGAPISSALRNLLIRGPHCG